MDDNSTRRDENTFQSLFCDAAYIDNLRATDIILPLALNVLLAISAIVGNTLILVALCKVSSLHPPSKLLFRCLAITDILAGVVTQPLHVVYLVFLITRDSQRTEICRHTAYFMVATSSTLYGVSLMISVAISVDRVLALFLGLRYRHTVTFKRTFAVVLCFCLLSITFTLVSYRGYALHTSSIYIAITLMMVCVGTSGFCYTKIVFKLRRQQNQIREQTNRAGFQPNVARLRRIVCSAVWVQGTLDVCFMPFIIVSAIALSNTDGRSTSLFIAWEFTIYNFLKFRDKPICLLLQDQRNKRCSESYNQALRSAVYQINFHFFDFRVHVHLFQ